MDKTNFPAHRFSVTSFYWTADMIVLNFFVYFVRHLTGNLLKEIRSGCFSANAKLEKLLLGYNQISELGENSFEGLTLLEEL